MSLSTAAAYPFCRLTLASLARPILSLCLMALPLFSSTSSIPAMSPCIGCTKRASVSFLTNEGILEELYTPRNPSLEERHGLFAQEVPKLATEASCAPIFASMGPFQHALSVANGVWRAISSCWQLLVCLSKLLAAMERLATMQRMLKGLLGSIVICDLYHGEGDVAQASLA